MDHQATDTDDTDRLTAPLAGALARLRRVRAALADHGAPLAPILEETDRALAMGERLLAKAATGEAWPRAEVYVDRSDHASSAA